MRKRLPGLAATFLAGVLGLACSSSSSASNTSVQATWCSSSTGGDGFAFDPSGTCFYVVRLPSGSTLCGMQCSYTVSGSTLTMTTTSSAQPGSDAGAATLTCSYALTFSNGGNTLEIKSDGGQPGCQSFDATVQRSGLGTGQSCSFGC